MLQTRIIPINDCSSDGDSNRWPTAEKGFTRNDAYLLDRVANKWAPDIDPEHLGVSVESANWRLDKLPSGYAGFEKARSEASSTGNRHIDRFIYGHPNGAFRSLNEFYPHFKHLMDIGGPIGCTCKLCLGLSKGKRKTDVSQAQHLSDSGRSRSSSKGNQGVSPTRSAHFSQAAASSSSSGQLSVKSSVPPTAKAPTKVNGSSGQPNNAASGASISGQPAKPHGKPSGIALLPQGRLPSPPRQGRRKQADEEGIPDVYRTLIDKVLSAGEDAVLIDEPIQQSMSPDWRAGNEQLKELISAWRSLPQHVPRVGEVVLFVRDVGPDIALAWDLSISTWRRFDVVSNTWLDRPKWEAGVVTQMPVEPLTNDDLYRIPSTRKSSVVDAGFRIEPLAAPGDAKKDVARRYQYVPLHGLRSVSQWQDCFAGIPEIEWHPTVRNALAMSNTMCVLAPTRLKGGYDDYAGPEATVFCQGAYIGHEAILIGDTVRLLPHHEEQKPDTVTDIMVITAIKARLVALKEAGDDDWDEGRSYTVCLHVSGRAYTQDPARGFTGMGKVPSAVSPASLPDGMAGYGPWYHMLDPKKPSKRLEAPFTRLMARLPEPAAMTAWYSPPQGFASSAEDSSKNADLHAQFPASSARGLKAVLAARSFAYDHDPRIDKQLGKTWYWADTRIDALDLHEVNNKFVGVRDDIRTRKQLDAWREALRAMDGKKGGLQEYHAAQKKLKEEAQKSTPSYGMVGATITASVPPTSGEDVGATGEEDEEVGEEEDEEMEDVEDEEMGVDTPGGLAQLGGRAGGGSKLKIAETIDISD